MVKISICDDEISFCNTLEDLLIKYSDIHKIDFTITKFESSIGFLDAYTTDTDIVFLDIQMPIQNGLVVAEELRKKDTNVFLIFLTSLRQYVFRGYDFHAYQYILKPVNYRKIEILLDELIPKLHKNNEKCIFVKVKGDIHKIFLSDLKFIETNSRKALLHIDTQTLLVNKKMHEFDAILPTELFFRCHSSYIVNLSYISKIVGYDIYLSTGDVLPLSKHKKGDLLKQLAIYWGGEII